jgi:hypothetical protein
MSYVQLFALTPPVATFLGALVGATAAIAAAILTTWRLMVLERMRLDEARKVEESRVKEDREKVISEDLSDAVQQLTIKMAASLHSMCWLTWLARQGANRVDQPRLDLYDKEQHQVLPEILGYLSTVAALDADIYKSIKPLVYEIYTLDAYIGEAGLLLNSDRDLMLRRLVDADHAMVSLEMYLPQIVGDVVSKRVREPRLPAAVSEITHSVQGTR